MTLKKKVKKAAEFQVVRWIANIFYFSGLTSLIPLLPLVLSPQQLVEAKYAFGLALAFIFAGFLVVYWYSTRKVALKTLGMSTLIPGLFAVIFSFMGPRRMANVLRYFGEATPFLEKWIETYVPKAWLLSGIYIIIGVTLIWLAEK